MDFISKQKSKSWIIILLVFLNIGTILQLWVIRRPHHPPPFHHKDRLFISDLNMSEEQSKKFEKQRNDFFDNSGKIVKVINEKKSEILTELYQKKPSIEKLNSLSNEIGDLQKGVEKLLYKDILKMKEIMSKEQFLKFKKIIKFSNKLHIKGPKGKHKRHPRHKKGHHPPPHHERHPR